MFSYRHAFHAGGHADVLKHLILIHLIKYLQEKPGPLTILDTQAGAGIYSLKDGFSKISNEADNGIFKLINFEKTCIDKNIPLPTSLVSYLALIRNVNPTDEVDFYPGSPYIFAKLLRHQDRLKLFELHPSEIKILHQNINQLSQSKQIDVFQDNGFMRLKAFLPPLSRRGLTLVDPSYEDKLDYRHLETALQDALKRFATGCYAIWYPVLSRQESIALPERLKKIAAEHNRSWLQTELRVENSPEKRALQASGMFVINPPWTLSNELSLALPILKAALEVGAGAMYLLKTSEI